MHIVNHISLRYNSPFLYAHFTEESPFLLHLKVKKYIFIYLKILFSLLVNGISCYRTRA